MVTGALTTLLVGAWVASAGPVALFRRQNLSGFSERSAPGTDFEEWSNVPPPPKKIYSSADANETVVAVIVWGLRLLVVAIVATVVFLVVRELWQRTEHLELKPGDSYSVLRRNFTRGLNEAGQGAVYASKYVGGLTTLRDRAGSGRQPLTPVDAAKQRAALDMLATEVLSADSFNFSPAFLRKMTVSTFDIDDAQELGRPTPTRIGRKRSATCGNSALSEKAPETHKRSARIQKTRIGRMKVPMYWARNSGSSSAGNRSRSVTIGVPGRRGLVSVSIPAGANRVNASRPTAAGGKQAAGDTEHTDPWLACASSLERDSAF